MEESRDFETIAERVKARRKPIDMDAAYMPDESPVAGKDKVEVVLNPEEQELHDAVETKPNKSIKAERYLELIAAGEPAHRAARFVGSTAGEMAKSPDMKAAVKKLIDEGTLPALVRKSMVRAGLDKIFMENLENKKGHKTAIQAAKLISSDPDVGLNAPPQGASVNIDLGELGKLMETLTPIKGLESILDVEEEKEEEKD